MIKVALIDDEPLARSILKEYLSDMPEIEIIGECANGLDGLKFIQKEHPDLIFLDVQMPKITGFEMLELIENPPAVIFTTAYDEYALKAFETNAIDYLLKPFNKSRLEAAVNKWKDQRPRESQPSNQDWSLAQLHQPEEKTRVVVKEGSTIRIIPVQEIFSIEAFDDYVKIFTKDEYFLKKKTLNYFEEILPSSDFVRVHRSYLVHLKAITRIEPYEKNSHIALLKNDRKVPLSRSGLTRLKEVLES